MVVFARHLSWYDRHVWREAWLQAPSFAGYPWQEPSGRHPSPQAARYVRNEVACSNLSSFQSRGLPQRLE
jgi:hypothetical protein